MCCVSVASGVGEGFGGDWVSKSVSGWLWVFFASICCFGRKLDASIKRIEAFESLPKDFFVVVVFVFKSSFSPASEVQGSSKRCGALSVSGGTWPLLDGVSDA